MASLSCSISLINATYRDHSCFGKFMKMPTHHQLGLISIGNQTLKLKQCALRIHPHDSGKSKTRFVVATMALHDLRLGNAGHDLVCTAAVFTGSLLWVRIFDHLVQKGFLDQKLSRKLIHISTGILYASIWPIFSASPTSRFFAVAIPTANIIKLLVYGMGIIKDPRVVKSISRGGTSVELLRGPLYYVLVLAICTIFFWRDSPVGVVALAIMCGGDGIADIAGRKFGSSKLPYNSGKSWAGSVAMFTFGFFLSVCFLYYYSSLGFYDLQWTNAVRNVALISFVSTLVESLPISSLDDNMTVPAVAILLGAILLPSTVL